MLELGLTLLLIDVGVQLASTPGIHDFEPPKPPVGVQLASIPGIHDFEPPGTLVEGAVAPCPGPLGPVGVMLALVPPPGVVLGGTVLPPGGAELGFSL